MPKLLREYEPLQYDKRLIKESVEHGKPITLSGVLQRADVKNQNGRKYPREILEREVQNYQKQIAERVSVGQLDHPVDSVINLSDACHIITDLHWEGQDVVGTLEVLPTPKGNIVKQLLEAGVKIGISSRAVGETKKDTEGCDVVTDSLQLVCWDIVSAPSVDNAWLSIKEARDLSLSETPKKYRVNKLLDEILTLRHK